jgi:hypothetical protein
MFMFGLKFEGISRLLSPTLSSFGEEREAKSAPLVINIAWISTDSLAPSIHIERRTPNIEWVPA